MGFSNDMFDLIRGIIILIVGLYVIWAILGALEIGKIIVQFIQSVGFGVLVVAGLVILYLLLKGEL